MPKVKITFTETKVVNDEHKGTDNEQRFVEGKSYTLDEGSAHHWLSRGVAFVVGAKKAKPPAKQKAEDGGTGDGGDDGEAGDGDGAGDDDASGGDAAGAADDDAGAGDGATDPKNLV